jgi:tetratricopeptide (TPR) repeat protein
VRATVSVSLALLACFVATYFINSAYRRERAKLGDRHFRAGQALIRVNDLSGAAEEFRKALLFAPDNREYELLLARALVQGGRLDEAESHLEQLSQADPTNGQINLLLAQVALQQHHVSEAEAAYQRAVYEYWPPDELNDRRTARWELIDLMQQDGTHRDQLVGELLQLYGNLPPHSDQRMHVGTLLLQNGADAEAAHVFHDVLKDAASESQPQATANEVQAHSGLAKIAFRAGDFIDARHEYQHVLKLAPDDLATSLALQLANEIIEMSPQLPNISPSERLRRSQSLLTRVEADLRHCAVDTDQNPPKQPPPAAPEKGFTLAPRLFGKAQALIEPAAPAAHPLPVNPSPPVMDCPSGQGPNACSLDQRLQQLKSTLAQKPNDKEDEAAMLQQAAQQLWKDRATFCPQQRVTDPALEAVLPRLGYDY